MMEFRLEKLRKALLQSYDKSIAHPEWQSGWTKENPTHGCCVPTALIVQDYFGGDVYKHNVRRHYYNFINGEFIDLTRDQFNEEIDYKNGTKKHPSMDKNNAQWRYETLKNRVEKIIEVEEARAND